MKELGGPGITELCEHEFVVKTELGELVHDSCIELLTCLSSRPVHFLLRAMV